MDKKEERDFIISLSCFTASIIIGIVGVLCLAGCTPKEEEVALEIVELVILEEEKVLEDRKKD